MDSQLEFAYMAGLIDGEGCLRVAGKGTPYLSIGMTNKELIESLKERYGGSLSVAYPKKETHKLCYHWSLSGYACGDLLRGTLPYMRVKKELAQLVIAYFNPDFTFHDKRKGEARQAINDYIMKEKVKRNGERVELNIEQPRH